MTGIIVCIEGLDGAGKHTQALLLAKKLKRMGYKVSLHSYPEYGSRYGRIIKAHLRKKITLNVYEFFLMFVTDMVKDKVSVDEELIKGSIVVMDRYYISTVAYQSAGGFDFKKAKSIENAIGLTPPSVILYLDVPVDISQERKIRQKRLKGGADRHEADKTYLEKVKRVYDRLYKEGYGGARWVKIDGTGGREEIHGKILFEVLRVIVK